jgi:hypothetical protein
MWNVEVTLDQVEAKTQRILTRTAGWLRHRLLEHTLTILRTNFQKVHIAPAIPMVVLMITITNRAHCHREVTTPSVKASMSKPCAMCRELHQQHGLWMDELG